MGNCSSNTKTVDVPLKQTTSHTTMHDGILRELHSDVYTRYEEIEVLGQGSMGHVAKVQVREGTVGGSAFHPNVGDEGQLIKTNVLKERRQHKVEYALKMIRLDRVKPMHIQEMKNEIEVLKGLDHPNIIKAHEQYVYKKHIYLILELCDGGDLNARLPYTEHRAATIVEQITSAVKYMHDHGIVHRDLKFENVMFENKSEGANIKVIDFGLSKKFLNNQIGVMHKGVGTLYTVSPQVLQGEYSSQADLWSVGVITFMLLSSRRPFYHKDNKVMMSRIKTASYTFKKDYWKPISDEAKDFVARLLVVDVDKRMTAGVALKHVWLTKECPLSESAPDKSTADAVQKNLMHYNKASSLKKIALNVIAHKSSCEEIMELRKLFHQFDTENNGVISYEDFQKAMKDQKYTEEELKDMFHSIDVNHNGHIMYTEFLAAALEVQGHIEEERLAEAFDRLDSDDSGFISRQNLRDFLGKEGTTERIDKIIEEGDKDHDGQISYEEFLQMFRKQTKAMVRQVSLPMSDDEAQ